MGNSEVGHNALGAGRVFQQGASLVGDALASGRAFATDVWQDLTRCPTLHLLGLVSDGNVHSHIDHLLTLVRQAATDGVQRLRVHLLTDGRDVGARTALTWVTPLEQTLAGLSTDGRDYRIASGGGRMRLTMDRYLADWAMVGRGYACHVHGQGRPFASATEAIETFYADDPDINDQYLPAFVVSDATGPVGRIQDHDGVLLFNFRGDRALEISRMFERRDDVPDCGQGAQPDVLYAGLMQYDGDEHIPRRYLVDPPAIDRTVGQYLAAQGLRTLAISETQKFGHVTYFFNGNRSERPNPELETWTEVPSDNVPFETRPEMKAAEITAGATVAILTGTADHVRLNLANGYMVGHTGDLAATIKAVELLDACVGALEGAVRDAGGVLLVTADHGNADQMIMLDKKTGGLQHDARGRPVPCTSHSLNPVPFVMVDPSGRWQLSAVANPGLANVAATVLNLLGHAAPDDYLPSLVELA
jgi:2,3-bisphosphoglycerate-independent phosphoglycerate mutase